MHSNITDLTKVDQRVGYITGKMRGEESLQDPVYSRASSCQRLFAFVFLSASRYPQGSLNPLSSISDLRGLPNQSNFGNASLPTISEQLYLLYDKRILELVPTKTDPTTKHLCPVSPAHRPDHTPQSVLRVRRLMKNTKILLPQTDEKHRFPLPQTDEKHQILLPQTDEKHQILLLQTADEKHQFPIP
ncbi:hypothetical protein PoB_004016700 [Plakobranchus ocellatus]|uniref:Uncharacterized protein n=1 Tax=Plakobranchus ocellatus TaxID=259542 RepID=A0AAV4B368_9GAST|nr:hypothetical protein PoB_004016700 [Plakobranchus ocellatus]